MAAHYWRLLLLFELGFAAEMAALVRVTFNVRPLAAALAGLGILLLLPCALIGVSFATARFVRSSKHSPERWTELLRPWVRESVALQRAALAMSVEPWRRFQFDGFRGGVSQPANPILLIHGVLCNRGVWRPLASALHAHGFGPIRAVNLEPLLGNIDAHATYVASEIRQLRRECGGARVAIIAHSMGGLVARAALTLLEPDDISQIVTLGSPHHGSLLARLLPGLPNRQMLPASDWLASLNALQEGHFPVPVACIYSANDNLVRPTWSAALEGATRIELEGLGHLSLLDAQAAIDCTLAALTGSRAGREPCLT
jgi:pimeloyl-ACP methyl ester carboxylesterase